MVLMLMLVLDNLILEVNDFLSWGKAVQRSFMPTLCDV